VNIVKKDKKKENYLDRIPYIPEDRKWELKGGIVYVTQVNKGFYNSIAQKLFKTPKTSKIKLEGLGSFIWQQIDGNRSIYDIGMLVADKYGEKANPLYERLSQYIKTLDNLGFIQFK
jgi:hypothetical protein